MSRAIDADALINRIVFHTDWTTDEKEAFEDEINAEPTIEERKKGKWVLDSDKIVQGDRAYRCSNCRWFIWMSQYTIDNHFHFCPNCGTDMRGEQE